MRMLQHVERVEHTEVYKSGICMEFSPNRSPSESVCIELWPEQKGQREEAVKDQNKTSISETQD